VPFPSHCSLGAISSLFLAKLPRTPPESGEAQPDHLCRLLIGSCEIAESLVERDQALRIFVVAMSTLRATDILSADLGAVGKELW